MKRFSLSLLALLLWQGIFAQTTNAKSEDFFQALGKIYVVVAIIVVIFLGISWYLWRLDHKITELENKQSQ